MVTRHLVRSEGKRTLGRIVLSRFFVFGAFLVVVSYAGAAVFNIKDGATDWTSPNSYDENDTPTGAGDIVIIKENRTARLTAPSASLTLVNTLDHIEPAGHNARLEITVPLGEEATLSCPFTSYRYNSNSYYLGRLIKNGAGTLALGTDTLGKVFYNNTSYAFYTHYMDVVEGSLKLPQNCPANTYLRYGEIAVSNNAAFYTASGTTSCQTFIHCLQGEGLVTNVNPASSSCALNLLWTSEFNGVLGGGIMLTADSQSVVALRATNSTFGASSGCVFLNPNSHVEVAKFGFWTGESSSMGTNWKFQVNRDARVVYTGNGERTSKTLIVVSSPFTIDGGPFGGLEITSGSSASEFSGFYGSAYTELLMHHLILDGSNTTPCVFGPYIRSWKDNLAEPLPRPENTFYITKRGTGIWKFVRNMYSNWKGGVCAEDGTLQYDTLLEQGVNCSFGLATQLQVPYCGPYNVASNVEYAVALGGGAGTPMFEYVGTNFVSVTTRPIGIKTRGRLLNSGTRRLRIKNAFGVGTGAKELILDGTSVKQDQIDDITDGEGVVSVTKKGAGEWVLGGNQTFSGKLNVEDGTLYVHDSKHYSWYKWTVKQTHAQDFPSGDPRNANNYGYQIAEFAFYDAASNRVNIGMSTPAYDWPISDSSERDAMTDYTILSPHSAAIGRHAYKYDKHPLTYEPAPESLSGITMGGYKQVFYIFDDAPAANANATLTLFNRSVLKLASEKFWVSLYMCVTNSVHVTSYDWAQFRGNQGFIPTHWKLEASVNGFDWDLVDEKSGIWPAKDGDGDYNYWSCTNGVPAPVQVIAGQNRVGYPIAATPTGTPPQVLNNATVVVGAAGRLIADGDVILSKLEIDATGAGTIDGFTFAGWKIWRIGRWTAMPPDASCRCAARSCSSTPAASFSSFADLCLTRLRESA